MNLLDVNLLVKATNPKQSDYPRASQWFEDQMNGVEQVAIPWHSLVGFLRVSTQPSVRPPIPMELALQYVEDWLEWDNVWVPIPKDDHFVLLAKLLREKPQSRLVPDAHLAALAIEHNLTLCSTDTDFRVFTGLKFLNPLE
jgi:toxin-antitoxin system PIN domain toxin